MRFLPTEFFMIKKNYSVKKIAGSSVPKLRQRGNERVNSHADGLSCRMETVRTIQLRLGLVRVNVI
jgi:hypothetical protein